MGVEKYSLSRQIKDLQDRCQKVEEGVARMALALQETLNRAEERSQTQEKYLEAVVEFLGKETIQGLVAGNEMTRAKTELESAKANLEQGVKDGYLVPTKSVSNQKCFIVGKEYTSTGEPKGVGESVTHYSNIKPQFQSVLFGKNVGDKIDLGNTDIFEIAEVYDINEENYKQFLEKKRQAQQTAVTKAAEVATADQTAEAGPAV